MSQKRFWTILALSALLSALLVTLTGRVWPGNKYTLRIEPVGLQDIVLEYGQEYKEAGATAVLESKSGECQELPVTTEGSVDTDVIGEYTISYTAKYKFRKETVYRKVRIMDTEAPVITLVSDPERFTLPNQNYEEEGFTATDNYDGDLTDAVCRVEENGVVIYTVTDTAGNTTSVVRTINYYDPEPPVLTLKGEAQVVIPAGDQYIEPGYTAMDNCDGDITASVTVTGGVDNFRIGRYTLTYTTKDSYDNTASATRTVFVKERSVDKVNDPTNPQKVIYLTFDDGPGPETPRLLDILKKYNVQATFFVVNTGFIPTIRRAAEEGHTVAIHTNTHVFRDIYASEDAYFQDLYTMQQIIQDYTGQTSMLLRFPGGSSNTISRFNKGIMTRLTEAVEEKGFRYYDWNVDSHDAGGVSTAQGVYESTVLGIGDKQTAVVLMHDIKGYTVDAVEPIVVWGLNNGYTFLPLTSDSPVCHHRVLN